MKIGINIQKKYFFVLVFFISLLVIVGVFAYNSGGTGGNPQNMGHSVDEIDWSKNIPGPLNVRHAGSNNIAYFRGGSETNTNAYITIQNIYSNANSAGISMANPGGTNVAYIRYNFPNNRLDFFSGGGGSNDLKMVILNNGEVGIGITNPNGWKLAVNGPVYANGEIMSSGNIKGTQLCIGNDCKASWYTAGSGLSLSGTQLSLNTAGITACTSATSSKIYWDSSNNRLACGTDQTSGSSYWTASGNNIYNSNTGNIGIGTTSPSQKLDVNGNIKGTQLCIGNDCKASWYTAGSGLSLSGTQLSLNTAGITACTSATSSKIYWDSSNNRLACGTDQTSGSSYWTASGNNIYNSNTGNIGIGTTSPAEKLEVNGVVKIGQALKLDSQNSGYYSEILHNLYWTQQGWRSLSGGPGSLIRLGGGTNLDSYIAFWVASSPKTTAKGDLVSIIQALTINKEGNIGIGTDTPAGHLHINKNNYALMVLGDNAAGKGFHITKESSDNSFNIWSGVVGNAINRLKITQNGNVGIGTTSPAEKLHVDGNIKATGTICDKNGCIKSKLVCINKKQASTYYAPTSWQTVTCGVSEGVAVGGGGTCWGGVPEYNGPSEYIPSELGTYNNGWSIGCHYRFSENGGAATVFVKCCKLVE